MSELEDLDLREGDGGVLLKVRVLPGSSRNRITGVHGSALKIVLRAPPEKGKANKRLLELLAEALGLSARSIMLVSGTGSRDKLVLIPEFDSRRLRKALSEYLCS